MGLILAIGLLYLSCLLLRKGVRDIQRDQRRKQRRRRR